MLKSVKSVARNTQNDLSGKCQWITPRFCAKSEN